MSDVAFAELTREAVALPYEQQKELVESLNISIRTLEAQKKTKSRKTREEMRSFLNTFRGRSHCWDGIDVDEFIRKLREDRDIVQTHIS